MLLAQQLVALILGFHCHILSVSARKPASDYFRICTEKDQESLNECIKSTMIELKPVIAKGIPEIGLPPAEPLYIERIEMVDGQGNFRFRQILKNLRIYGLSDYEIQELNADWKNLTLRATLFQKHVDFDGNYEMDGQILVIPIKGQGQVIYNFTDITVKFISHMEKYKKNGQVYVRVKKSLLNIDPRLGHSHFTNLFNGNKRLGEATNKFLNDNWRAAFEAVRDLPEKAFGEIFTAFANNVYNRFPLKELFPSVD